MYIIIVGCGKVGHHLARALLEEGHEVLAVEKDAKQCERVAQELGSIVVRGDGCEAATLADVGTGRADVLVAATGDDEDNLVACQVAKHKFHVPRTIARISNPKNEAIFTKMGIDITVSTTNLILEYFEHELPTRSLVHLMRLKQGGLEIVSLKIPPDAAVVGKTLREITLPPDSVLSMVINKDSGPIVPSGDTVLQAEDEVVAVTKIEVESALRTVLTGTRA